MFTNTTNTTLTFSSLATVAMMIALLFSPTGAQAESCNADNFTVTDFQPSNGSVTIENTSDNSCQIGLASYKGFELEGDSRNPIKVENQELFDDQTTELEAGGTVSLDIDVPSCAYQIDVFHGDLITDFSGGDRYQGRKLNYNNIDHNAYSHENINDLCGDEEEEEPDPDPVSCPWNTSNDDVYTFSDNRLISHTHDDANKETDPTSVNLSAGTYDVEIFTSDSYTQPKNRNQVSQPHEQSYLSLRDSNGVEIAKTDDTDELADNQTTAEATSIFPDVEVGSGVTDLVGVHANYDHDDSPNSHNFTCAKLTKQSESEPIFSCPFDSSDGTVITFDDKNRVRADKGHNASRTNVENVNLTAGTYRVQLYGYDEHENRSTQNQPRESYFISLLSDNTEVAQTPEFGDLDDGVNRAEDTVVFDDFTVPSGADAVVGISAPYADGETDNANSIDLCAAFEKVEDGEEPDELTGTCEVSPNRVETGEDVTFSADASGGNSPYTFSWELEGSSNDDDTQDVTTSYDDEGTYEGTVTIEDDDGDQIERTCSVRVRDDGGGGGGDRLPPRDDDDDDGDVRGDRDVDFGVQCLPDRSTHRVGEVVTYNATIDSDDIDEDDVDFDWSGQSGIDEDGDSATIQYRSTGIKEVRVEAEYDGETESDTCYVQIGRGAGVTLDQVPYTGPGDAAKTIGFITTLLLMALAGGYAIIRRREEDGIPVGIPTNQG